MIDILLGCLGAIIFFGFVGLGFWLGWHAHAIYATAPPRRTAPPVAITPEEADAQFIRRQLEARKALEEEQKAFQAMMGYNADVAYGLSEDVLKKMTEE